MTKQTEEFKVNGEELLKKVKQLIAEGNVRRIIIRNKDGKSIVELPMTIGLVGAVLAPPLSRTPRTRIQVTAIVMSRAGMLKMPLGWPGAGNIGKAMTAGRRTTTRTSRRTSRRRIIAGLYSPSCRPSRLRRFLLVGVPCSFVQREAVHEVEQATRHF